MKILKQGVEWSVSSGSEHLPDQPNNKEEKADGSPTDFPV
jgi:hypothetical protein